MSNSNEPGDLDENEIVSAFLPPTLFERASGDNVTIVFTLFDNPSALFPVLFEPLTHDNDSGNVTVVGTPVIGIIVPSVDNVQNLPQPVEIHLRITTPLSENDVSS